MDFGLVEDRTAPSPADRDPLEIAAANNQLARYIPLAQAAAEIPHRRRGRKTNISTLYRWTASGCRGVKLRYVQVGATRCTTRLWLEEFFAALTRASGQGATAGGVASKSEGCLRRTPTSRRRAVERADRELDALGV